MATRNSAGIGKGSDKNVNPIYKAAVTATKYIKNVGKEYGEWRAAQPKSKDGKAMPEAGQAWGALLQARRYDKKGNQIK